MAGIKLILISACLIATIQGISGHGYMWEPVSRSTAFRRGHETPANYNDMELFCGGIAFQEEQGGKCGVCGDKFTDKPPRANENGGFYGTGKIVQKYQKGQRATIEVVLTANHKGHFEFAVCPLNKINEYETEECFNKHPVQLADGGYKYEVDTGIKNFKIDVILPQDVTCEHCSFRWHYRSGNNVGICEDGTEANGCGPQEQFRNCADISIL